MRRWSAPRSTAGTSTRGTTLIELLVATAVASVVVLAASYVYLVAARQNERARTSVERLDQTFTALTQLERSLVNLGYHAPTARFAIRTLNNISTEPAGLCQPPLAAGCFVPGSDVLEVLEGHPLGMVKVNGLTTTSAHPIEMLVENPGFPPAVLGTDTYFFVFVGSSGNSCLARGTLKPLVGSPLELSLTMLDRQFNEVTSPPACAPAMTPCNYDCPVRGMTVGLVSTDAGVGNVGQGRRRFALAVDATTQEVGMYTQTATCQTSGNCNEWYPPTPVVLGVDQFQVVPLARRDFPVGTAWSSSCGPSVGLDPNLCECNVPGASCSFADSAQVEETANVVGVRVLLTSRGVRPKFGANAARQLLADETYSVDGGFDTMLRTAHSQTFLFRNLAQVQP